MTSLSVVIIVKKNDDLAKKNLASVRRLADEIVILSDDDYLKDDLGKKRKLALSKVKSEWVLALDSDEMVTPALAKEIKKAINSSQYDAYLIPYQNHFFGKPINHGGENYKVLRLFKKDAVTIKPSLVHEKYEVKKGKVGELKNKMNHFSYRSILQVFKKFTDYAGREARQKMRKGEQSSIKKLILYPIHMFWARFIEDKGYKDGLFRIPLDLMFAYMEFMTYFLILTHRKKRL
jgi:hypothetical protein